MSVPARDAVIVASSALLALGVALAGGEGMRGRASARVQRLDQRMGQRLDGMERRQSLLQADVSYQTRSLAADAPAATAGALAPPDPALAAQVVAVDEAAQAQAQPQPSAPSHPLLGAWRCSFRQQEFSYPPMACEIRRKDGGFFLEKTQGSQRIKGTVTPQGDDRFEFQGLYFCPFGDCDEKVSGTFERKSRDHWVGALRDHDHSTVVTLRRPGAASSTRDAAAPAPRSATKPKTRSAVEVLSPFE